MFLVQIRIRLAPILKLCFESRSGISDLRLEKKCGLIQLWKTLIFNHRHKKKVGLWSKKLSIQLSADDTSLILKGRRNVSKHGRNFVEWLYSQFSLCPCFWDFKLWGFEPFGVNSLCCFFTDPIFQTILTVLWLLTYYMFMVICLGSAYLINCYIVFWLCVG